MALCDQAHDRNHGYWFKTFNALHERLRKFKSAERKEDTQNESAEVESHHPKRQWKKSRGEQSQTEDMPSITTYLVNLI